MQQMTSPPPTVPPSASCTASTSCPAALRMTTRAPRGSNPSSSSCDERGRLRNRMRPVPPPLVVNCPTRTPSTSTSKVAFGSSFWPLMSSLPSLRFRTASFTLPRASGSTPVDASEPTSFSVLAPAGRASADRPMTVSTASAMVIDLFMIPLLWAGADDSHTAPEQPMCRARERGNPATYDAELVPAAACHHARCAKGRSAERRLPTLVGRIDQHAGVEDPARIEHALGGAQRLREQLRALLVVPRTVVATDGVVVRDGAAVPQERIRCRGLDRGPLLELGAGAARREDRVVGRRAVGIHVREAAGDDALTAHALHGIASRGRHRLVERGEALPGDGGLERLADHAEPHDGVAQVGRVEAGG